MVNSKVIVAGLAALFAGANIHSAPDVDFVGPNGEVVLFYRDGDTVVYKECVDHTVLNFKSDCKLKPGTSIQRVGVSELKQRLKSLINVKHLTSEKTSLEKDIARIRAFINDPVHGGQANADNERLAKLEADLDRVNGLLSRKDDFKEAIEELVEEVISNQKMTPIKFSDSELKFQFFVLSALRGDCATGASSCSETGSSHHNTLDAEFQKIVPIVQVNSRTGNRYTFLMGSPNSEKGRENDELQHEVTLTKNYEIQTTDVTQEQWFNVMGNNPSRFRYEINCPGLAKDGQPAYSVKNGVPMCRLNPVEQVSADDVQEFLNKLNGCGANTNCLPGPYRLPTEAEWEYAARGGQYAAVSSSDNPCQPSLNSAYSFGNSPCNLGEYAWYSDNSGNQTREVATRKANPAGLFDMHGNVWQWVADGYSKDYGNCPAVDPISPADGSYRVYRGGGFCSSARGCRSADRLGSKSGNPGDVVGFRLARTVQ